MIARVLSHDMIRNSETGIWRCVSCNRIGTIEYINEIVCPNMPQDNGNVLAAIQGELKASHKLRKK